MNANPHSETSQADRPETHVHSQDAGGGVNRQITFCHLLWLTGSRLPEAVAPPEEEIAWLALIRLVYEQRMLPLLHDKIVAHLAAHEWGKPLIPKLRDAHFDNARRNLTLAAETLRLIAALEAENIPTLAFKGCVLSCIAYGNLTQRKGGDIDLLVKKGQVFQAMRVLEKCGYQSHEEQTQARQIGHVAFDCEWELFNRKPGTGLDLHWEFSGKNYGLPAPMERIWERLQTMTFAGHAIRAFSPEDLVLMLCVHAAKHYWQRLEWIYTLARVLNRYPTLDWQKLQDEARRFRADRILTLGLSIVDRTYQTPLPEALRRKGQADPEVQALIQKAMGWLQSGEGERMPIGALRHFSSDTRPGFSRKVYYWFCAVTTPTARDYIVELPSALHWVYFFIRGFRLVGETIRHLFEAAPKPPVLHPVQWIREPEIIRVTARAVPWANHSNGDHSASGVLGR